MEVFVGSESAGDYFNIQNLGVWRDGLSCLFWACFWLSGCVDCLLRMFCVIDFAVNWWDSLLGLFVVIVFPDWFWGWLIWLLISAVFYWTVVILWERRKIKVWRCIAMLPLLNPMSKWVRSDSSGWSFDLDVYCLLRNAFLFWTMFCERNKPESFDEPWRILFLHRRNAAICLVLFL